MANNDVVVGFSPQDGRRRLPAAGLEEGRVGLETSSLWPALAAAGNVIDIYADADADAPISPPPLPEAMTERSPNRHYPEKSISRSGVGGGRRSKSNDKGSEKHSKRTLRRAHPMSRGSGDTKSIRGDSFLSFSAVSPPSGATSSSRKRARAHERRRRRRRKGPPRPRSHRVVVPIGESDNDNDDSSSGYFDQTYVRRSGEEEDGEGQQEAEGIEPPPSRTSLPSPFWTVSAATTDESDVDVAVADLAEEAIKDFGRVVEKNGRAAPGDGFASSSSLRGSGRYIPSYGVEDASDSSRGNGREGATCDADEDVDAGSGFERVVDSRDTPEESAQRRQEQQQQQQQHLSDGAIHRRVLKLYVCSNSPKDDSLRRIRCPLTGDIILESDLLASIERKEGEPTKVKCMLTGEWMDETDLIKALRSGDIPSLLRRGTHVADSGAPHLYPPLPAPLKRYLEGVQSNTVAASFATAVGVSTRIELTQDGGEFGAAHVESVTGKQRSSLGRPPLIKGRPIVKPSLASSPGQLHRFRRRTESSGGTSSQEKAAAIARGVAYAFTADASTSFASSISSKETGYQSYPSPHQPIILGRTEAIEDRPPKSTFANRFGSFNGSNGGREEASSGGTSENEKAAAVARGVSKALSAKTSSTAIHSNLPAIVRSGGNETEHSEDFGSSIWTSFASTLTSEFLRREMAASFDEKMLPIYGGEIDPLFFRQEEDEDSFLCRGLNDEILRKFATLAEAEFPRKESGRASPAGAVDFFLSEKKLSEAMARGAAAAESEEPERGRGAMLGDEEVLSSDAAALSRKTTLVAVASHGSLSADEMPSHAHMGRKGDYAKRDRHQQHARSETPLRQIRTHESGSAQMEGPSCVRSFRPGAVQVHDPAPSHPNHKLVAAVAWERERERISAALDVLNRFANSTLSSRRTSVASVVGEIDGEDPLVEAEVVMPDEEVGSNRAEVLDAGRGGRERRGSEINEKWHADFDGTYSDGSAPPWWQDYTERHPSLEPITVYAKAEPILRQRCSFRGRCVATFSLAAVIMAASLATSLWMVLGSTSPFSPASSGGAPPSGERLPDLSMPAPSSPWPTQFPTPMATADLSVYFAAIAPFYPSGTPISHTLPGTPQYEALYWLANIDKTEPLRRKSDQLAQRYALVVLHFAFGRMTDIRAPGGSDAGVMGINNRTDVQHQDEAYQNVISGSSRPGITTRMKGIGSLGDQTWLDPTTHECDWGGGVMCGGGEDSGGIFENNHELVITELNISGRGFSGTLPPEIGMLRNLIKLNSSNNHIKGFLPNEICKLSNLSVLDMHQNLLTANLPDCIGNLSSLTEFDLSINSISGTIPVAMYSLKKLRSLNLSQNRISGELSPEIGSLQGIKVINMADNHIWGVIPEEYADLPYLSDVRFDRNKLSGSVPFLRGQCLRRREIITLSGNQLSGTFPREDLPTKKTGGRFGLRLLDISSNNITGPIPEELGFFPLLEYLDLSKNQLHGTIPNNFGHDMSLTKDLVYFSVANNGLDGTIPLIGHPKVLRGINLSLNKFHGTVMTYLSDYHALTYFNVMGNQLHGSIPKEIRDLALLEFLDLRENGFTGSIPATLGAIQSLEFFSVASNSLEGTLPSELGHLRALKKFCVSDNSLVGVIPPSLGHLKEIRFLELDGNKISGEIPPQLSALVNVEAILLNKNDLVGAVPIDLCSLKEETGSSIIIRVDCSVECNCCYNPDGCI